MFQKSWDEYLQSLHEMNLDRDHLLTEIENEILSVETWKHDKSYMTQLYPSKSNLQAAYDFFSIQMLYEFGRSVAESNLNPEGIAGLNDFLENLEKRVDATRDQKNEVSSIQQMVASIQEIVPSFYSKIEGFKIKNRKIVEKKMNALTSCNYNEIHNTLVFNDKNNPNYTSNIAIFLWHDFNAIIQRELFRFGCIPVHSEEKPRLIINPKNKPIWKSLIEILIMIHSNTINKGDQLAKSTDSINTFFGDMVAKLDEYNGSIDRIIHISLETQEDLIYKYWVEHHRYCLIPEKSGPFLQYDGIHITSINNGKEFTNDTKSTTEYPFQPVPYNKIQLVCKSIIDIFQDEDVARESSTIEILIILDDLCLFKTWIAQICDIFESPEFLNQDFCKLRRISIIDSEKNRKIIIKFEPFDLILQNQAHYPFNNELLIHSFKCNLLVLDSISFQNIDKIKSLMTIPHTLLLGFTRYSDESDSFNSLSHLFRDATDQRKEDKPITKEEPIILRKPCGTLDGYMK